MTPQKKRPVHEEPDAKSIVAQSRYAASLLLARLLREVADGRI
jgi:hypothetical protein